MRGHGDLAPAVLVSLAAESLAGRDEFRGRVALLLVDLEVAAREGGAGERSREVARRVLELLAHEDEL